MFEAMNKIQSDLLECNGDYANEFNIHHGSHFFRLTNFPCFTGIFQFSGIFNLKYGTIFAGSLLFLADKFSVFFFNFPV